MNAPAPTAEFEHYHAHIYFDAATKDRALALSARLAGRFDVELGNVHERLVGPHPRWSRQVAFRGDQHDALMAWLERERDGLTIFVHGLSGDDLADHTRHVAWLGETLTLDLSMFKAG